MYMCAKCGVEACRIPGERKLPKNCPMREEALLAEAVEQYSETDNHEFYVTASEIEGIGRYQWCRVKETLSFCRRMGYHRIGLAFCGGVKKEAAVLSRIMEKNGFEVISVMCKAGGVDKCETGIRNEYKIRQDQFEPMCNPIFQAKLLNSQKTEFNIVMGLCVGHDSFLYKYSDAFVTTLFTKDRVLGHNAAAALYQAEGFYKDRMDAE